MCHIARLFAYLACAIVLSAHAASNPDTIHALGSQGVNLWKLQKYQAPKAFLSAKQAPGLLVQDGQQGDLMQDAPIFRAQWFKQPLDHFDKSSKRSFHQRYWVSTRHYKPGKKGPVIVLDGGETSGENRIPFLDTGIVDILARSTGGVGVILEHRYYGESIPVSNLSTDSLRWLNNEQAAADSANFMANVEFEDIEEDLTAPGTPWIYYGGSYAGARAAHMKILYPDLVFGAIASSGVTHAVIENWQYMDVIRRAADPKCSSHLVNSIKIVDGILTHKLLTHPLKALFGLGDLKDDVDFVAVLASPVDSWQLKNWDPAVSSTKFDEFCEALSKPFGNISSNTDLPFNHPDRMIEVADGFSVDLAIFNYAGYIKANVVSLCSEDMTHEECFGTSNDEKYRKTTLDQDWRLWQFQVCTQWGYFTIPPPDESHPRVISKLLTLDYGSKICKQAFPPGKYFTVPSMPNVTAVNALGDFDIAADYLAIIDGEVDPWRPDTPHSEDASDRADTILRPFKLIPGGIHRFDENGLPNLFDEPPEIRKIHEEMIFFVREWLKDWKAPKSI